MQSVPFLLLLLHVFRSSSARLPAECTVPVCIVSCIVDLLTVVIRLIAEQRQKNAEAEKSEKQALQARQHAETAGNRIQQCQDSLHAAERLLAEKQRELAQKVNRTVKKLLLLLKPTTWVSYSVEQLRQQRQINIHDSLKPLGKEEPG